MNLNISRKYHDPNHKHGVNNEWFEALAMPNEQRIIKRSQSVDNTLINLALVSYSKIIKSPQRSRYNSVMQPDTHLLLSPKNVCDLQSSN